LVIALCGPIGSPLHEVAEALKRLFEDQFAYDCRIIRLSKLIEEYEGKATETSRCARILDLISKGNKLRQEHGTSILADLAIREIALAREGGRKNSGTEAFRSVRICHIVDSIKNQQELETLRLVYRDMLHCIGVFSPMHVRERKMQDEPMTLAEVYQLVDKDSGEEIEHGQTVRETFPRADYFLRADGHSAKALEERLLRFLNLIFDIGVVTPAASETAMYHATAAARNSGCLSRQVGAALVDTSGQLLAVGWNDVPKADGDLYREGPATSDHRCVNWTGRCHNDEEKRIIAREVAETLAKNNLIAPDSIQKALEAVLDSRVGRLIEFSRAIHAEMHAILSALRAFGSRVVGGSLYCTTYPCHSCARHIVAAGVRNVFYIEPYRKSLALKLHHDSVSEKETDATLVRILPYDGVAPSKYLDLFEMKPDARKKDGVLATRKPREAAPKCGVTLESLPALEALVVNKLKQRKLIEAEGEG
jgi:deoxycytidylate deaminase